MPYRALVWVTGASQGIGRALVQAAVDQWVRTTGNEQARRGGVQVLSVAPGRVATAMHEQLRGAEEDQLPDHPEFIRLHEEGLLQGPQDVARQLWSLLDEEDIPSGRVLDLRDYPAQFPA